MLSIEERRLFTVMAVFAGGATLESVEAVCREVLPRRGRCSPGSRHWSPRAC